MRNKWMKALCLVTAVSMLAGCGTAKPAETKAPETKAAETEAAAETSAAPEEAAKPTATGKKLKIGTMANALGLPVHQADVAGYFKDAGLDVEIEIFATGAPINEAMAAGSIDVAVSGMASVYGLATGMYTYVGDGVITSGGESIYARPDSEFASIAENDKGVIGSTEAIKGKSILGPLATTAHYQAINYCKMFDVSTEEFSMVSMDYAQAYQAFLTGEGDLLATKMPYTNQLAEEGYIRVCDMSMVNDSPIVDAIFVQNKVAEEQGADIELFLDCYYKACADLMNDEAARRATAMEWYASEGVTYSESDMDSEVSVKEYYTLDTVDEGENELASFMVSIGEFFVTQDMISPDDFPKVEASVNRTFLDNVKAWNK